jgi:hypothetical protein
MLRLIVSWSYSFSCASELWISFLGTTTAPQLTLYDFGVRRDNAWELQRNASTITSAKGGSPSVDH